MKGSLRMARRSVAEERREQILAATLKTIAERGISGTTLDRIADTAGMSRGHVRHFIGNREALLVETAREFYKNETGELAILPTSVSDLDGAVDYFFGEKFTASSADDAVALGLVELSRSTPEIADVLNGVYAATRVKLVGFIASEKRNASVETCEWAAEGILAAAMGNVFIGDFDRDSAHTMRAQKAVKAMLGTL